MTYSLIIANENIVLSWNYPFTGGIIVSDINDIESTKDTITITLPNATQVVTGTTILFNNTGSYDFTVLVNDGKTPLFNVVRPGEVNQLYLINNNTPNGEWRVIPFGGGVSAISSLSFKTENDSLKIDNATVTPPKGNVVFTVADSLNNINALTDQVQPGTLRILKNTPSLTFETYNLTGENNIKIEDDVVKLENDISISRLTTGNTVYSDGSILVKGQNNNLTFKTDITSNVNLNGLTIDGNGNLSSPSGVRSFGFFYDNNLTTNNIVIETKFNLLSVSGANGSYVVNFDTPMPDSNYLVQLTLQKSTESITPFAAFFRSRSTTGFILYAVDTLGNLLPVLDGVGFSVFYG